MLIIILMTYCLLLSVYDCYSNTNWSDIENEQEIHFLSVSTDLVSSNHIAFNEIKESLPEHFVYVEGGALSNIGNGFIDVKSFCIDKYEVTYSTWLHVLDYKSKYGYIFDNDGEGVDSNYPVVNVSWYDCVKWCNLRSEIDGRTPVYVIKGIVYKSGRNDNVSVDDTANGFRLPSDAEWEYAARGGICSKGFIYSGSDNLNDVGWYLHNSKDTEVKNDKSVYTKPVGLKQSNELGIYDMSGNAREWCYDWYPGYKWGLRIVRGGSWKYFEYYCRVSSQNRNGPKFGTDSTGFRVMVRREKTRDTQKVVSDCK